MKRSLNFEKIKHRINPTPVPFEVALEDIAKVEWPNEVRDGKAVIEIHSVSKIAETQLGASMKYVSMTHD